MKDDAATPSDGLGSALGCSAARRFAMGELTEAEEITFLAHVDECDACRELLPQLAYLIELAAAADVEPN